MVGPGIFELKVAGFMLFVFTPNKQNNLWEKMRTEHLHNDASVVGRYVMSTGK